MVRPNPMTAALAAAVISASAFMPLIPVSAAERAPASAVCPPAAQNKADHERLVLEKEHTDAVSMCLDGQKNMRLFTKADLAAGNGQRFAPEDVAFHVTDALKTQVPAKGFEFTGAAGKDAWMIPETQNHDGIWAGWNTEEIREGMVDGDHVTMRLNQKKSSLPEGAQVEIFQAGLFGTKRILSSADPKHSTYAQSLGSHVHANWTFTKPGVYRLVFSAEATVGGKKTADQKEFVFAVGKEGLAELKKEDDGSTEQPKPENPGGTETPGGPGDGTSEPGGGQSPNQPNPPTDSGTPELAPDTVTVTADKDSYRIGDRPELTANVKSKAKANARIQWQTKQRGGSWRGYQGAAGNKLVLPKLTEEYRDMQVRALAVADSGAQTVSEPVKITLDGEKPSKDASKGEATAGGSASAAGQAPAAAPAAAPPASAPQPCIPDSSAGSGSADDAAASGGASGGTSGGGAAGSGQQGGTAPKGQRVRAEAGHFDFGARLSGGKASAQIKDDRTAPPVWRSPDDVDFIIGAAAKKPVPAGYEFLGSEGSQVYMISQQQEDRVPWLGWNTQDPEIMNRASKVTMTLTNVSGPGQMHVFLGGSGLGGGSATRVFSKAGDSYQVPVGTHQHGFWAFTKPGSYTATIRFTVALKSGGTTTADGTLHFTVGGGPQAGGSISADKQTESGDGGEQQKASGGQASADDQTANAEQTPAGQETPGGSASSGAQTGGDPCALPRTGVSGIGMTGAVGLGLLSVGAAVVWIQRRRAAK